MSLTDLSLRAYEPTMTTEARIAALEAKVERLAAALERMAGMTLDELLPPTVVEGTFTTDGRPVDPKTGAIGEAPEAPSRHRTMMNWLSGIQGFPMTNGVANGVNLAWLIKNYTDPQIIATYNHLKTHSKHKDFWADKAVDFGVIKKNIGPVTAFLEKKETAVDNDRDKFLKDFERAQEQRATEEG